MYIYIQYIYHISLNKCRGVYFKLLTAKKAFTREGVFIGGPRFFFSLSATMMSLQSPVHVLTKQLV